MDWTSFLLGYALGVGTVLATPWIAHLILEVAERISKTIKHYIEVKAEWRVL